MDNIRLINNTEENIRLAIFKMPYQQPSLQLVTWDIIALPQNGGNTDLYMPKNYQVYINYSNRLPERDDPYGGIKTGPLDIDVETARFIVREEQTNDRSSSVATLKRVFRSLVNGEIHIENRASFGVWGHILLNGNDVYPPEVVTPGRTLMEDVRSPMYLALIDQFVYQGAILKVGELRTVPTVVLPGDEVTVKGSKWTGYEIISQ